MSGSVVPTVQVDPNGVYSVAIAPGVRFVWWFEKQGKNQRCWFKVDAPSVLSKHYELVSIDERSDIISFPVQ